MSSPIEILLLEDDPNDAGLIEGLLEADHFICHITRVQSRTDFLTALEKDEFDLILSDHKLPSFDGLSALNLALSVRPDLPFIFVSGTLGEEAAIEALKVGATDYVLKTRMSRLVPAVRRALGEAGNRAARQRAEDALRERERKIRRLVDANIIGIIIWDIEGRIFDANDAFLQMVGYDRTDLASGLLHRTSLTPPEWHASDAQRVEEVKMTGTVRASEKEYFRKDGSRVPVLVGAASFEETGNQGVAFVLDLSERKKAEAEAREIERRYREVQMELAHANRVATMGQLTASIAHEVNQPITATIGNAEAALRWLAHRPPDLEESRRLLARIVKDGHRASNVVSRIRDLIKKAPPRMERMEINGAIGEVIELTRGETMKNCISVQTQLAEGLPFVEADRTQLQQVMLNLIINAVHALSESGQDPRELSISTSMNGSNGVLISVRDSGQGISPEHVGRLFDPFYTTKPGGMGMGLSICRSIIEGHGGRIWATANDPRGAAFHFTIPIARQ